MQHLGQHFLKNKSAISDSIATLDITRGETIIEIGSGEGALTLPLLDACTVKGAHLISIERDRELAENLGSLLASQGKEARIITGDALELLPKLISQLTSQSINYKIVGNIPYYITGQLLRLLSELVVKPLRTVLMIQKEVAERLMSMPPRMNLLAASVQYWAKPRLIRSLKQTDFSPPPKVLSSIVSFTPLALEHTAPARIYFEFLHIAFKQPRKMLVNNLMSSEKFKSKEEVLAFMLAHNLPPTARAQTLSIAQLSTLAEAFPTA